MAQHRGVSSKIPPAQVEKRRESRRKILNTGEIVYLDGHSVDCAILDISEHGARIRVGDYTQRPKLFTLRVGSGRSYRCQFVWQDEHELGCYFLSSELPSVLLVDDDHNALAIYEKELSKHFDIKTAKGGEHGLAILESRDPFAVVISDMRMPDMNGARFLGAVARRAPDTVRIMLTGYSDLNTAMEAINLGHVYAYLTKPCSLKDLVGSIKEGVDQYRRQVLRHLEPQVEADS